MEKLIPPSFSNSSEDIENNVSITLKVPYVEAKPGDCGIGSVAMLIAYNTNIVVSVDKLVSKYKFPSNYIDDIGWKHDGLIAILRAFGVNSNRAEHQTNHEIIKSLEANRPVIASVKVPDIRNLSKNGVYLPEDPLLKPTGHLCVVVGVHDSTFLIHDPRNIGKYRDNLKVPFGDFSRIFTGRCIYLS